MASKGFLALPLLFALLTFLDCALHAASQGHQGFTLTSTQRQRGRRLPVIISQSKVRKAAPELRTLATWDPVVGHGIPLFKSSGDGEQGSSSSVSSFSTAAAPPPAPSNAGYKTTEEVSKPIQRPRGVTPCTVSILTQEPFYTYEGDVPVSYAPPTSCGATWQLVVVSVSSQVTGRQFDRRFSFFLDSLPLVVATTAEPVPKPGTIFKLERDITAYSSFLQSPHSGDVILGNVVDSTYTGVFYVNVTLEFYPGAPPADLPNVVIPVGGLARGLTSSVFTAPPNAYKAAVELYISHYDIDEFYYFDVPNSYYDSLSPENQQNFINGTAFRELVALLDGFPVGVVFPKVTFYSGALDPRLWSPFMGIGSLNMLLYNLDITPFVGLLLDGKPHNLTFSISYTTSTSFWVTTGALKIWTDPTLSKTTGAVISQKISGDGLKEKVTNPGDLNTNITTWASRSYQFSGFVISSLGRVSTNVTASLSFKNIIQQYDDAFALAVRHETYTTSSVVTQLNGAVLSSVETSARFPFDLFYIVDLYADGSYSSFQGVAHKVQTSFSFTTPKSSQSVSLNNQQSVQSVYGVNSSNYLTSYSESTTQNFKEKTKATLCSSCKGLSSCYARDVASQWSWSNITRVFNQSVTKDTPTFSC